MTAHAPEQDRPDVARQCEAWFDGQLCDPRGRDSFPKIQRYQIANRQGERSKMDMPIERSSVRICQLAVACFILRVLAAA